MLHAVEVGQLDHPAGLALRAVTGRDAALPLLVSAFADGLLQEERDTSSRTLIAQRAKPVGVTRSSSGSALAADDYPVERLRPRAIRHTCWYVIP